MNLVNGYSPESQRVTVDVESNLLETYFSNFKGLISKKVTFGNDIQVKRLSKCSAQISFPIDGIGQVTPVKGKEGMASVGIDKNAYNEIISAINKFVSMAVRYKLDHTEFIPLYGYPVENFKEDIKTAVENKRDLCIIKDYKEFLKAEKSGYQVYNQYVVSFDDDDYCDTALLIYDGDMKKLRKKFKSKLTLVDWI